MDMANNNLKRSCGGLRGPSLLDSVIIIAEGDFEWLRNM